MAVRGFNSSSLLALALAASIPVGCASRGGPDTSVGPTPDRFADMISRGYAALPDPAETAPPTAPVGAETETLVRWRSWSNGYQMVEAPPSLTAGLDFQVSEIQSAAFEDMAVPAFVNMAFGDILGVPFEISERTAARRDLINLRIPVATTPEEFFRLAATVLDAYGIAVGVRDGVVRVTERAQADGTVPTILRTRSHGDTPRDLRPVAQYVPLISMETGALQNLLNGLGLSRVSILSIQSENALVLVGTSNDVSEALAVIETFDRPRFDGRASATVTPSFWTVDEFARELQEILAAEGVLIAIGARQTRPVTIVPVERINSLVLFAETDELLERTIDWARELDRPNSASDEPQAFVYQVRNTAASELSGLIEEVVSGTGTTGSGSGQAPGNPGGPGNGSNGGALRGGEQKRLIVDPNGNQIVFVGTPSEYARILPLMRRLDTPPREVLIEVMIADITVSDQASFGVEAALNDLSANDPDISVSTLGGLGLGGGGLGFEIVGTDARAIINAFASSNNVNILSTPRVVARSGQEARISVGSEIPIITSQRNTNLQTGGTTDVLQQIEYRQTGIILSVNPVVHGQDRIQLSVNQEISESQSNPNQSIPSPVIVNRSLATELSLRDGSTGVLGGLIQTSYTRGDTRVPLLGDIPLLGTLFRTDTVEARKTELLVLLTPYILDGPEETAAIADTMVRRLSRADGRVRGSEAADALFDITQPRARNYLDGDPALGNVEDRFVSPPAGAAAEPRSGDAGS